MIRLKQFLLILVFAIFAVSCRPEGRVYVDHQKLSPDVEWLQEDSREFEVPISEAQLDQSYALKIAFRYATGYRFRELKIKLTEISPDGEKKVKPYTLTIRDEKGDYIGDPGYDIWDSEHLIEADKSYAAAGTYRYVIAHDMPADPLNFAMEIGLILDEK